jgi:outer membrane protein OmpA-like peptidoglycan-associated protein
MKRIFLISIALGGLLFQTSLAHPGGFITRDEIIKRLGGESVYETLRRNPKTGRLSPESEIGKRIDKSIEKSIRVVPERRAISVSPRNDAVSVTPKRDPIPIDPGSRAVSVVPETGSVLVAPKHISFHLYFRIDSTEFNDRWSERQLAQLGLALSSGDLKHIKVKIGGHTCSLGSNAYNHLLSQRRANRIRDDLIYLYDIDPARLVAVGYGERYPNVPNISEKNRTLNRRVVIERLE